MTTGWHLSEDRDHLRGRPTLFSGRAKFLFTVVKPTLSGTFPARGALVGGHAGPIENGASEALPLVNLVQGRLEFDV